MNKLLILPFDHRSSFVKNIAKTDDPETVKKLKWTLYQAFLRTWEKSSEKESLAILIDDQYGREIIADAKAKGIKFVVSIEKSGGDTFEFEHGDEFGTVLEEISPTYAKVLIRYSPDNTEINQRQLINLEKLALYKLNTNQKVILELLVPPMGEDKTDPEHFDQKIRPAKTVQAINEISAKINPDIWKMEGFSKENWELIFSQVPLDMDVIVLGRGEDEEKVNEWLATAAEFNNIIGFAVGRTVFSEPLIKFQQEEITEEQAISDISDNFEKLVDLWNSKKSISSL